MPEMLLHWSPRSPFVRKVMIAAHECGLADRIERVRTVVAAATPNIELMKENPQSRLPTLRLADGTVVYDSPVICEYFDTLHGGAKLFPESFPERLVALRRQSLGDGGTARAAERRRGTKSDVVDEYDEHIRGARRWPQLRDGRVLCVRVLGVIRG